MAITSGGSASTNWTDTGATRVVTRSELGVVIPFHSIMTAIIDSVTVRLSMFGTVSGAADVYISDGYGNVISNTVRITNIPATESDYVVTGLNAAITSTFHYNLAVKAVPPAQNDATMYGVAHQAAATTYTQTFTVSDYQIAAGTWVITTTDGYGFPIGGWAGFQPSGEAWRSLDVGSVPTGTGIFEKASNDAPSYPIVIDLYSTNNPALFVQPGITGWALQANVSSGDVVQPAQYFRFHIRMTANPTLDMSPVLDRLAVYFDGVPQLFTTQSQLIEYSNGALDVVGTPVLDAISTVSSQLTDKPAQVFAGKVHVDLANDQRALPLLSNPIIGKSVHIAVGYSAAVDRIPVFNGAVEDVRYTPQKITLIVSDNIKFADVMVPQKDSYASYDTNADYAVDALVTHKFFTWKSLTAHGMSTGNAVEPGTDPAVWQQITFPKIYDATTNGGQPWHLVDIALDILRNEINIPDNRINFVSFDRLRTLRSGYTGTRTITKPEKAKGLLGELAWLLEAQWIEASDGIALVPEVDLTTPLPAGTVVPIINDDDIATGSFRYRRGWKELVNECLIFSAWDGSNYQSASVYADATSVATHHVVQQETGYDKWSMPAAVRDAIAQHVVSRKANGRRVISITTSARHMRLEAGDRCTFESSLLPASDPQTINCVVVKKDIVGWKSQKINITLQEVF